MTERPDGRTIDNTADRFGPPERWAPRLDRVLAEQESLYAALDALSESQAPLIESDDGPGLLRILAQRQETLERIAASNEEFAIFRANWSELMNRLDDDRRAKFDARIDALAERIEHIARRDEEDQRALGARQVRTTERLADLARSRSALGAYGPSASRGPRFQDREG